MLEYHTVGVGCARQTDPKNYSKNASVGQQFQSSLSPRSVSTSPVIGLCT
jgi:hypothetical protein